MEVIGIEAIINEKFIELELFSNDKYKVLSQMTDMLFEEGRITDKATYLSSVFHRETLASTAVGFGVGIPHGKCEAVETATVVFARSEEGIQWNEEGEEVKLVFLLAIPAKAKSNHHLRILAALSRKLLDQTFIELLHSSRNKEDILNSLEETLIPATA